jgi:dethiobiotin synthetase
MKSSDKQLFVTGIGTEVGKTVVSAILVRALQADYWKPVQAGDLNWTDTDKVKEWSGFQEGTFFPETYRLLHPMSPHAAAEKEGLSIARNDFQLPVTNRTLIVEGAGGLYVPLNQEDTILDLIQDFQIPVVLVSRHYLGSINHTLLSIAALKERKIPIAALIFNGAPNLATEQIIEQMSGIEKLLTIDELPDITSSAVAAQVEKYGDMIGRLLG